MIAARFAPSLFGSVDSRRLCQSIHALNTFITRSPRWSITFTAEKKGWPAAALGAPAWVCTQCGEPLFEGREVDVIQNAIKALDRENEKLLATR